MRVRLTGGTGDVALEHAVEPSEDRVARGEGGEERFLESAEGVPRDAVRRDRRVVGRGRDELGEGARPGLVASVGERRVVGRADRGWDRLPRAELDDPAVREDRRPPREKLPEPEDERQPLPALRQKPVGDDDTGEAVPVLGGEA